ncbi:melanoma-associated antigen B10-like [Eptesicus fuscus]|uniref:melanoma-associated antigen B10-like n=1 Tax=Eptesicus fuscus TaxID=29078 RepID=UPI00240420A0|nr:melanoma-associated antigen B10-like [Eptesicus fuscus]
MVQAILRIINAPKQSESHLDMLADNTVVSAFPGVKTDLRIEAGTTQIKERSPSLPWWSRSGGEDPEKTEGPTSPPLATRVTSVPDQCPHASGEEENLREPQQPLAFPSQKSHGQVLTPVPRAAAKKSADASQAESGSEGFRRSPLDQKAMLLAQFMLRKYNMKEPITKEDMMKHVIRKHRPYFQEILKRASELMVLAFGIDVKEADPAGHSYVLVSKLHHAGDSKLSGEIVPRKGLLMTILCVIFMKGNCATEEEIWDVLNAMGIHAGKQHNLHGEPMKLITEDLVKEGYLVYRQVPHSDPPSHEFLWGPQAYAETSKMEVLQFLAKLHGTEPSAFPHWYEEALQDELERTRHRFAAMVRTSSSATELSSASFSIPHKY